MLYIQKVGEPENKIADSGRLVTNSALNIRIREVENKVPDICN